jgi:hypothetical protein
MTYPHIDPDLSAPDRPVVARVWQFQVTDKPGAWPVVSGEECTREEITRCLVERYGKRFVRVRAMGELDDD